VKGSPALLTIELKYEHDVVLARQRTRRFAELLGLDPQDGTRLATAVSEIARNAFEYAGEGRVELYIDDTGERAELVVRVCDKGAGITDLQAVLDGRYRSKTGMGLGIVGARRLSDRFDITSSPGAGTRVTIAKRLGPGCHPTAARVAEAVRVLAASTPETPFEELQSQNQELLRALAELRERKSEIERLNGELEETNRGVLALYAELDERALYLTRANEMKTTFLSELSHELRTPLNAIRNVVRFLLDGYQGDLTDGQHRAVTMIGDSATGLAALVDDWLDLAKIEAGRIEVHPTKFTVDSVFGALRGVFRPLVTSSSTELRIDPAEDLPVLHTDETKVSQVLRNLISNAIKFTEQGEVHVSARVNGDAIRFDVTDSGIGVAEEDRERIFDEFTQVQSSLQWRNKGSGLGLPLSRKLARLLGGDVWLTPRENGGTIFSLQVPIELPSAAAAEAPPARAADQWQDARSR
jgi:signal transduction histidine kinase